MPDEQLFVAEALKQADRLEEGQIPFDSQTSVGRSRVHLSMLASKADRKALHEPSAGDQNLDC